MLLTLTEVSALIAIALGVGWASGWMACDLYTLYKRTVELERQAGVRKRLVGVMAVRLPRKVGDASLSQGGRHE